LSKSALKSDVSAMFKRARRKAEGTYVDVMVYTNNGIPSDLKEGAGSREQGISLFHAWR